ncbi:MAG: hypothetical protein H8D92_01880 [Pelagibacteraceae bacterium]|nr:hypothetical protein [Pelagibacteraceae bacterium]
MGSYHDYIPDSVVEAYYGWDVDERTPCGTCSHPLEEHNDEEKKCNGEDDCECKAWTEGWEPDADEEYERMRDERND